MGGIHIFVVFVLYIMILHKCGKFIPLEVKSTFATYNVNIGVTGSQWKNR